MHRLYRIMIARTAVAILVASAAAVSAESLKSSDQVLDFSESKTAAYKSWTADYNQSMSMFGARMEVKGSVAQKAPHRVWMQLDMPIMGQHSEMTMVMGQDGVMWQVMKMGSQQQIMKMDMNKVGSNALAQAGVQGNPLDQFDPAKQLVNTKAMCDFTMGASSDLDGQPMYVLDGKFKPATLSNPQLASMASTIGKTRIFIGQNDGFVHRLEQYDKSQTNLVMAMEFKNIKFNPDVPDSTFVYQPPANAQVMDLTQMIQQRAATPPAGEAPPPTAAPPPPAPAK
ncbi:MAG TPA: hypothetical protein VMP11_14145 [Verrucomicrobiae bacterium]|nr:hypothetical protein [Verrucomicrobiae bacterium]